MSNIVFFGQADAGKSTLAGYLISKYDKHFSISKYLERKEKEYPNFDIRLTYSSIINTNRDEQRDFQHHNSRTLHLRKINFPFDDVTIIDTPGSERYIKQRERGMYYGNIGIFFMEIDNILNEKYKFNTIAPIILWSKLSNKRMIFLITKFDMVDYSEDAYLKAVEEVNNICQGDMKYEEILTVPTAIEVDKFKMLSKDELEETELGENICSRSEKMPWYDGPTLIEAIESQIQHIDNDDSAEVLSFCITDQGENLRSGQGKTWKIKILSGILKVGDNIILAPVKDKHDSLRVLNAAVKELREDISRYEDKRTVDVARKGNIFGIDLKNCYIDKKHVRKTEFDAVSSTCGFSERSEFSMSEFFSFIIDNDMQSAFSEGVKMRLVWFGRSLPFSVFAVKEHENETYVLARLEHTKIALPKDNANAAESILIKGQGFQNFFNAKLIKIGKSDLFS